MTHKIYKNHKFFVLACKSGGIYTQNSQIIYFRPKFIVTFTIFKQKS